MVALSRFRRRSFQYLLAALPLVVTLLTATAPAFAVRPLDLPPGDDAVVTRVVDGDTVEIKIGDTGFTIGYLGINAPEGRPDKTPECFAKAFNSKLLAGKTLRLERDKTDFDPDGRLLRYAYLPDGRMVTGCSLYRVMRPLHHWQVTLAISRRLRPDNDVREMLHPTGK